MEPGVVEQLVDFTSKTRYPDIPEEAVNFGKGLIVKIVAGMVAGSAKPSGRKMATMIRARGLPGEVGVIGSGFKTSVWEATFLHAFYAHASELEDDRVIEGSSWDITVIPLLFSLCEKLRLSGKTLLESIIVGLEAHCRTSIFPSDHLGLLMIPPAVGPALAASKVMGLNKNEMTSAIGLAMSGAPLSFLNFGTDAHYLESTLQCFHGLVSAEMAKEGMYGNSDIVAFLSLMLGKDKVVPKKMVEDLGKKWIFTDIWIKKYPLCLMIHRYIDTLLELKRENNFTSDDVELIEAHINPGGELCNRPEPKNERDLQFSYHNALAAALVDGDVNLSHVEFDMINDPKMKEARAKVKLIKHMEWPSGVDAEAMTAVPAQITVKMKNGKTFFKERKNFIGSPEEPLTMDQFKGLYYKFTHGILPDEQIKKTQDMIMNLENLSDTDELMDTLVFRHRA